MLSIYKRTDKNTELAAAINETYKEMVACVDPRRQQDQIYKNTVIGREEYPIPESILRINHPIKIIEGTTNNSSQSYPLRFLTKAEYDEWEPYPNAATIIGGKPWGYCMWKNSILLTHVPDKVYKLELSMGGEAAVMSGDSDQTIFTPTWDETIKAGSLSRMFALVGLTDDATNWAQVYRYGFLGSPGNITGGLELLKRLNDELMHAPIIVKNNDF